MHISHRILNIYFEFCDISPISEEREKSSYTKWIYPGYIPHFEGYSRYFTNIAHAYLDYVIAVASACVCVCFHRLVTKTFDTNGIKLRI